MQGIARARAGAKGQLPILAIASELSLLGDAWELQGLQEPEAAVGHAAVVGLDEQKV